MLSVRLQATHGQTYDPGDKKYDNEPFLKWLTNVAANATIPDIFTISYQDYEDTLSTVFMQRVSAEAAQLAIRGTTLVTGSGDWGVGCGADGKTFRGDFPSSSPYVVSTGATTFDGSNPTPAPGTEVGITFSSGGFSTTFAQPSYQSDLVKKFLKQCNVPTTLFNRLGRGFPVRLFGKKKPKTKKTLRACLSSFYGVSL